jgi:myo-inositol 2-dehydrogenase/D-chiro-inositol 1-dehydrogenase
MTVRVGVIGTGMIGQDHIRRITQVVSGGAVTAVVNALSKSDYRPKLAATKPATGAKASFAPCAARGCKLVCIRIPG